MKIEFFLRYLYIFSVYFNRVFRLFTICLNLFVLFLGFGLFLFGVLSIVLRILVSVPL